MKHETKKIMFLWYKIVTYPTQDTLRIANNVEQWHCTSLDKGVLLILRKQNLIGLQLKHLLVHFKIENYFGIVPIGHD